MKIEQTIFEELIEQVIDGKMTRKEISRKYKICWGCKSRYSKRN